MENILSSIEYIRNMVNNKKLSVCNTCKKFSECKFCSVCKLMPYCSKECQREDWHIHKQICKEIHPLLGVLRRKIASLQSNNHDEKINHAKIILTNIILNSAGYFRHFIFEKDQKDVQLNKFDDFELYPFLYYEGAPGKRGLYITYHDGSDEFFEFVEPPMSDEMKLNIVFNTVKLALNIDLKDRPHMTKVFLKILHDRIVFKSDTKRGKYIEMIRKIILQNQGTILPDQERKLQLYLSDGKKDRIIITPYYEFILDDNFINF